MIQEYNLKWYRKDIINKNKNNNDDEDDYEDSEYNDYNLKLET